MSGVKKLAFGLVLALGASALLAGKAEARSDVSFGVVFGAPVYEQPYYPPPVYYAPAPVYVEPPQTYYYPQPRVVEAPPAAYYAPRPGYYARPIEERRWHREDDED